MGVRGEGRVPLQGEAAPHLPAKLPAPLWPSPHLRVCLVPGAWSAAVSSRCWNFLSKFMRNGWTAGCYYTRKKPSFLLGFQQRTCLPWDSVSLSVGGTVDYSPPPTWPSYESGSASSSAATELVTRGYGIPCCGRSDVNDLARVWLVSGPPSSGECSSRSCACPQAVAGAPRPGPSLCHPNHRPVPHPSIMGRSLLSPR